MSDRRQGDRREKQRGVIVIKFEDAVRILVVFAILLVSVSANIVLGIRNYQYKQALEDYINMDDYDEYDYDEYDYDEANDDEMYMQENEYSE